MLGNSLSNRLLNVRAFAFDNDQRNAVDEQHDVRPPCLMASCSLNHKLLSHMEDIVRQPCSGIPVDVLQRKTLCVACDGLLQTPAQNKEVIHFLVGTDEAVVQHVLQ